MAPLFSRSLKPGLWSRVSSFVSCHAEHSEALRLFRHSPRNDNSSLEYCLEKPFLFEFPHNRQIKNLRNRRLSRQRLALADLVHQILKRPYLRFEILRVKIVGNEIVRLI